MCGFAGCRYFGTRGRAPIEEMARRIAHRGPDEKTHYLDPEGRLELSFARLAIIDLTTGSQPVTNEDGTVIAVLNGEIYNYVELAAGLKRRGHSFRSHGDAETIVHLYEEHGDDFLTRLEGMFAIALWDLRRARLLLARDAFGIKPLYYTVDDQRLAFASEVKALLGLPGISREPDPVAVSQYLANQYVAAPRTFFKSIRKVLPGHRLVVENSSPREEPYWDCARVPPVQGTTEEIGQRVLSVFDESIRLHLRSDVPVAAFLSGGLDSGLVVARAAALHANLQTFTLRFLEGNDESPLAEELSRRYATKHTTFAVEPDGMSELLPRIVWACDEPLADSGLFPNYVISRLAAEAGVKVVLTGAGGDELFAGYLHHFARPRELLLLQHKRLAAAAARALERLAPEASRKIGRALAYESDPWAHYIGHTTVWPRRGRETLLAPGWDAGEEDGARLAFLRRSGLDALNTRLYADLMTYLPDDILLLSDRMTMIHSIEGRVPFLYRPLAELALGIPTDVKAPGMRRKHLLREVARPLLPESFLNQPKKGFSSPMDRWLAGPLGDLAVAQLCSERSLSRPWWNGKALLRFAKSREARGSLHHRLFTLWMLELFCRTHLDRDGSAPGARLADL